MDLSAFIESVNKRGKERVPFFCLVDFELEHPVVWAIDELADRGVLFNFEGITNHRPIHASPVFLEKIPPSFDFYRGAFNTAYQHLVAGNSFLVNLTARSELVTSASLTDIYHAASARYKLLFQNTWVIFSPETFIKIIGNSIETRPMKGTVNADLPAALSSLLNSPKELAEHVTVVDLLRNDLSRVSKQVRVEKFRYVDKISTNGKNLFQTSSKIVGELPGSYRSRLGEILVELLPAGSICGAPKPMTCRIIRQIEGEKRGFYTGIAGYFDGESLNSCVLIRYIEKQGDKLFYRSGGGITAQSDVQREYEELIDKVYVPTTGVYQNN